MKSTNKLPQEIYNQHLKEINGTAFSLREIEIIASLFLSDDIKQNPDVIPIMEEQDDDRVAFTYKLSERTVFSHIDNICKKLSALIEKHNEITKKIKGKGNKIKFAIQKSDVYSFFDQYCTALRLENLFLVHIEKIFHKNLKDLEKTNIKKCIINVEKNSSKSSPLFYRTLARHLNDRKEKNVSKIITTVLQEDEWWNEENSEADYLIYIVTENSKNFLNKSDVGINKIVSVLSQKSAQNHGRILFLLDHWKHKNTIPQYIKDFGYIHINEHENYYATVFNILKALFSLTSIDKEIAEFQREYQKLHPTKPLHFKKHSVIGVGAFCVGVLFFVGLSAFKKPAVEYIDDVTRSDLRIPVDNVFLKRPHIINQMDSKLRTNNNIKTIALVGVVGIGGAGKTTMARYYGKSYTHSNMWELNAESHESLMNSFTNLAYALAQTPSEKEELASIKTIQETSEKEKQIFLFVKRKFQKKTGWLLIYDNVESVSNVKQYFPIDVRSWGEGKVIITTRDNTIGNLNFINSENVIQVDQLSKQEALTLFCKIFYEADPNTLSSDSYEKTLAFLNNIPPFPLDVSMAAYYMKNSSLTFDQYLDRIRNYSERFEKEQQSFVKEVSEYTQTRFGIITSSIHKLIEINPEYKSLLLLMCFLDSQNIPLNFLEFYKDPILIDHFMRDVKKYSLITSQSSEGKSADRSFSLHRSTQTLSQGYLLRLLKEEEIKSLIEHYVSALKGFYKEFHKKDYKSLVLLIPHVEALIKNIEVTSLPKDNKDRNTQDVFHVLGNIYSQCSRSPTHEKNYFEKVYEIQKRTHYYSDAEMASFLKNLAYTCMSMEAHTDAIKYATKSLELCDKLPQSNILAFDNYTIIADAYTHKNDFNNAYHTLEKAFAIIKDVDPNLRRESEACILAFMGRLYSETYIAGDNAEKGAQYIFDSLKLIDGADLLFKRSEMPKGKISCFISRHKVIYGIVLCRLGRYHDALDCFKDSKFIVDNDLDTCPHTFSNSVCQMRRGEIALRKGDLFEAKKLLNESTSALEKLVSKSNAFVFVPYVFSTEVHIRLGELDEAYQKCLATLNIKKTSNTNYANLMIDTLHYHAAVIQYKLRNFKKAFEHFCDFINSVKPISRSILGEARHNELEKLKAFELPSQKNTSLTVAIKNCFQMSTDIFEAIYGKEHPFVRDYTMINNEEAKKNI
jgi:tetratricopeptide (TPR) repeat protein